VSPPLARTGVVVVTRRRGCLGGAMHEGGRRARAKRAEA